MKGSRYATALLSLAGAALVACAPRENAVALASVTPLATGAPTPHPSAAVTQATATHATSQPATTAPSYEVAIATLEANYQQARQSCDQGNVRATQSCRKALDLKHQTEREAVLHGRGTAQ